MMSEDDLKTIRMLELNLIREQERELLSAKESFVKSNGWHKEEFQSLRCVETFWCKDEDAISDIDNVIDLIEKEIKA